MLTWAELRPSILAMLGALLAALPLAMIPLVILRRKEPSSTIAWILTLLFLPAIGVILFVIFGRDRVRWPARRKRQADALVRDIVGERARDVTVNPSEPFHGLSESEQQTFAVSARFTATVTSTGNAVEVLAQGDEVYERLGAAIDAAKHHVHAEFYLIRPDATGAWFRDRLVAAAARGVQVRLLCDGYGCFALGPRWRRPLKRAGARLGTFLPMRSMLLQPVNLRNHRKIVVVDGTLAFSGGVNIGDEYRGRMPRIGEWRDTHLRIAGPAASGLQRVFLQDWFFATGEAVEPKAYFPDHEPGAGMATVAVVPSGPDTATEAIHRVFFAAISGAQERVLITTPYFVPDGAIVVALQVAAMRGVDVQIILPRRSNHLVTFHAGRSFYDELLAAGVHIHEYDPGMIHAKTMVVDGRTILVGSANMDMRSFRLNFEVHTLIHDAATAAVLETCFARDLARTVPVTLTAWRSRALRVRIAEGWGRFLSPLL